MGRKLAHIVSIFLLDLATSLIASIFAGLLMRLIHGEIFGFNNIFLLWTIVTLVAGVIAIFISGCYKIVLRHSTIKSLNKLLNATFFKEAVIALFIILGGFKTTIGENQSLLWMALLFDTMLTIILIVLVRVAIINAFDSLSKDYEEEVGKIDIMVYGTSNKAIAMVTRLSSSSNYNIIGFLTSHKWDNGKIIHDLPVYSYSDEASIAKLRSQLGFEFVLFADHNPAEEENMDKLSMMCIHNGIHVLNTPKISEMQFGTISQEALRNVNNNEMIVDGMSGFGRVTKRIFDCCLSGILLLVFSPLFLACYLALKLGDKGPAIYKQERIGRFGRPFYIYKFRSMRVDAEASGPALYSGDDDPRLTKVGKFLRQHHLDELPQLWNVFIGDMAFIGWRPERKFYIEQIMEQDPRYYYLYQIRPGVTSYATLKNGYTDTMEKMLRRLEFDLYYLRHRSWLFDLKILFQTFINIVFGKKF